ncbi:hypothetical protein BSKO_03493 [Bryopsis sp. KO-2023]|nr:hypothetical protein BSKO_03493 [Bryopsis sp. KO-2023]
MTTTTTSDPLRSVKRKLDVPNAFLQRSAVCGLFARVLSDRKTSDDKKRETILQCLAHPSQVVVEESVAQMRAHPDLPSEQVVSIILDALPSAAGMGCAGCLAAGLIDEWWHAVQNGLALPSPPPPFSEEPVLVAALLVQPLAQPTVIDSLFNIMVDVGTFPGGVQKAWKHLEPVFSWGLLWKSPAASEKSESQLACIRALGMELRSGIVRVACGISEWRPMLLPLLVRNVMLIPISSEQACLTATSTIDDIIVVFETEIEDPCIPKQELDSIFSQFLASCLQVMYDMNSNGMAMERTLSAFRHVARMDEEKSFAHLLAPFLPFLALLCMRAHGKSRHLLLGTICEVIKGKYMGEDPDPAPPYLPGILLLPAVQATTLRSNKSDQRWGPHLLSIIADLLSNPPVRGERDGRSANDGSVRLLSGELGLMLQCCEVLGQLWWVEEDGGKEMHGWLKSLSQTLVGVQQQKEEAEKQPFGMDKAQTEDDGCEASPVFSLVLCSLLTHRDTDTFRHAVEALGDFLTVVPTEAPSFFPVVLYLLQRGGSAPDASQNPNEGASLHLILFRSLGTMCSHPHVLPLVYRTLQTMMEEGSPILVRCLALRVMCSAWLKYGVGWKHLEGALNGMTEPKAPQERKIRLTKAACVRDICKKDSSYGLDLISCIQQSATDVDPHISAIGLACIRMMCSEDVLDFYKAWKVVQRWHPRVPAQEMIACEWVGMIAHGALDAEVHPEKVEALVGILWMATRHPSPKVRQEVYGSLAAYTPEMLEMTQLEFPLKDNVDLMINEKNPKAIRAAESAVLVALNHEHARRRRYLGGKAGGGRALGGSTDKSSLIHRLGTVLSGVVCSGVDGANEIGGSAMSGPLPGALLLCYLPKPGVEGPDLSQKFKEVFSSLCDSLAWSSWTHPYMALAAWQEFIGRWLAVTSGVSEPIWAAIQGAWSKGLAPSTGNALLAGGALCRTGRLGESNLKWLMDEAEAQLSSGSSSSTVSCAAHVLGMCGLALHPADWSGRIKISKILIEALRKSASGIVTLGCAEAVALMCLHMAHDNALLNKPEFVKMIGSITAALTGCLSGMTPKGRNLKAKAASAWPSDWLELRDNGNWKSQKYQDVETALAGLCSAISIIGCTVLAAGFPDFGRAILEEMRTFLAEKSNREGLLIGACRGIIHLIPSLSRLQNLPDRVHEACLDGARVLTEDPSLPQSVRSWASFSMGVMCATRYDSMEDSKDGQEGLATSVQFLIRLFQSSVGETELCCGAMMGLGALIGGVALPARSAGEAGDHANLLVNDSKPVARLARMLVKAIETSGIQHADPRVSSLATWLCVAGGHSAKNTQSSRSSTTGALSALTSLPADGAMRPLVERCLTLVDNLQNSILRGQDVMQLCSTMRCLRQAKRVPTVSWGEVCQKILRVCETGGGGSNEASEMEDLEVECIGFCLSHGRTPSHGLWEVVEALMIHTRFRMLNPSSKKWILENLASVVAALPAAHIPGILRNVPEMLEKAKDGDDSSIHLEILASAWKGLEAAMKWGPEIGKKSTELSQSLLACAADLFQHLPLPARVLPGDFHRIRYPPPEAGANVDAWTPWEAAVSCFKVLKQPEILRLTNMDGSEVECTRSMLMRCLLVRTDGLSVRDLAACRYWCMDHHIEIAHRIVSLGYSEAPTTMQHQILTETLESISDCEKPSVAFRLAWSLVAVWHSRSSLLKSGYTHATLHSSEGLCCFPSILSDLLTTPAMIAYMRPVVNVLCALLDSVNSNVEAEEWRVIERQVCDCLRAVRHQLDSDVLLTVAKTWGQDR